jgi:putative addiction module component (TIGR02574 family)
MTVALKKKAGELVAKLKPEDRVELADLLYATLPPEYELEVDESWDREIDRRLDELESGRVKTIPSAQVHAEMRRRLNEIKARRLSTRRAA